MDSSYARAGVSLHRLLFASSVVVMGLVGCGGSSDSANAPQDHATIVAQGSEPLPVLTLAEPRNENFTNRLQVAWTSASFTGTVLVREEDSAFGEVRFWTLPHNGPAVVFEKNRALPDVGVIRFELRYADGYVVLTALDGGAATDPGALIDVYPSGVTPVTPDVRCGIDPPPCYNGFGTIAVSDWPKRAGESLSLLIPRNDPAGLTYSLLLKPNEREAFRTLAQGLTGQSATVDRGAPWSLDFLTARVKVRGCTGAGQCTESTEQPLQRALVNGVRRFEPFGVAFNSQISMDAAGDFLVVKDDPLWGSQALLGYTRTVVIEGRWFEYAQLLFPENPLGFALSGDGLTLAVESSVCMDDTSMCNRGSVVVFRRESNSWVEQARLEGVRAPRLNHDGSRLATIGIKARNGDSVLVLTRSGDVWRRLTFPVLDYAPLDIALSGDGLTLAVARRGTTQDPLGPRAVVIYDCATPGGWRLTALLHSNKPLGAGGSDDDDGFGFGQAGSHGMSIDANGSFIAVGASLDNSDASDIAGDPSSRGALRSGAVYVFQRQGSGFGVWQQRAFIKARAAGADDRFGHRVALSANGRVLAGTARGLAADADGVNRNHAESPRPPAPGRSSNGGLTGAAAYVFESSQGGSAWSQRATVLPPTTGPVGFDQHFRLALSADGSTLALQTGEVDQFDAPLAVRRSLFIY
jgi:hypothetical protein